jgi:alpha-tubulin suppressor-like RCC1 family protein
MFKFPNPITIAVTTVLLVASSCQRPAEIVLVIDTDLNVPADIDRVEISVSGAMAVATPVAVNLGVPGAPSFPLTLGLTSGGALAPVTVSVAGLWQGGPVVAQDARTAFVEGEQRILRMLLLTSCLPLTCPDGQSCQAGVCGAIDRPGDLLPPWTGVVPPRPAGPMTTPIAGRSVWASGWHSCAIEGTTLYGWGQNSDGQLGTGNTQNANSRRPVMKVQDPASVGLGQLHSCICDRSGQAFCWGRNMEGQLGTGSTKASLTPIPVPGITDCVQIAAGAGHTCVVRSGGTVWCWGANTSGQVGRPAETAPVTTPVQVSGLTDVLQVQGGEKYTCALRSDKTIACWGDNGMGQLGDGTTVSRANPAPVVGLSDIAEIAAGRFFVCARHMTGQVACWGLNSSSVLGSATPMSSSVPLEIGGMSDAIQLAAGQQHACAIRMSGLLSCWGANQAGQLGDGSTTSSMTPVEVLDLAQVTSVTAGSVHTCARHSKGLACWGENLVNQLGDGSTTNRTRPVSVAGFL